MEMDACGQTATVLSTKRAGRWNTLRQFASAIEIANKSTFFKRAPDVKTAEIALICCGSVTLHDSILDTDLSFPFEIFESR
ncbi:hypothetical protein M514_01307 [Trichuris suis]|uniref:Uncharacterized protein n=1 Tax=Trichuris suis TaxID=68888 RepID=A0A085MK91_9BILA|nr:hypothetical protein M513_01307 [Trichuris suis]KFD72284.1 hypothetical protein M514_01307 [Trichuris suis]